MDLSRLRTGERIAAAGAIVLLISMWLAWYGFPVGTTLGDGNSLSDTVNGGTFNAWQAFGMTDLILLITVVVALSAALVSASGSSEGVPVAASSVVAMLGAIATVLVVYRILERPGEGFDLKIGIFIGLISAGAIAYGGWRGMQEEGTSLGGELERARSK